MPGRPRSSRTTSGSNCSRNFKRGHRLVRHAHAVTIRLQHQRPRQRGVDAVVHQRHAQRRRRAAVADWLACARRASGKRTTNALPLPVPPKKPRCVRHAIRPKVRERQARLRISACVFSTLPVRHPDLLHAFNDLNNAVGALRPRARNAPCSTCDTLPSDPGGNWHRRHPRLTVHAVNRVDAHEGTPLAAVGSCGRQALA